MGSLNEVTHIVLTGEVDGQVLNEVRNTFSSSSSFRQPQRIHHPSRPSKLDSMEVLSCTRWCKRVWSPPWNRRGRRGSLKKARQKKKNEQRSSKLGHFRLHCHIYFFSSLFFVQSRHLDPSYLGLNPTKIVIKLFETLLKVRASKPQAEVGVTKVVHRTWQQENSAEWCLMKLFNFDCSGERKQVEKTRNSQTLSSRPSPHKTAPWRCWSEAIWERLRIQLLVSSTGRCPCASGKRHPAVQGFGQWWPCSWPR